ncbi:hypothetical protein KI688_007047 [Linnemannia hyalina]|uniref:Uncharacterized protein n=1 Tax=Linnemannia hyalina TaxID=64524 RepID=A0A9P7XIU3_9FUNG|nr:hypothetical protein KI688_007047 [Linnemannia hyalina]
MLTTTSLPDELTGDVTIVGYDDQQPKLATSHEDITSQRLMKAHVENNSKQVLDPSDVEKALETVSSQAVQRKTEKELKKMVKEQDKAEKEQDKVEKEQKKRQKQEQQESTTSVPSDRQQPPQLHDFCPTGTYISMVITYPADVVNFQVVRPDPKPELKGLQPVSIDINGLFH